MGWNFGRVTRVYVCHVVYGSGVTKEGRNSTSLGKNRKKISSIKLGGGCHSGDRHRT
jgi:hypothetical protein